MNLVHYKTTFLDQDQVIQRPHCKPTVKDIQIVVTALRLRSLVHVL